MNEDKIMLINKILLLIMSICFFPIIIYVLMYIYNELQLDILNGSTFKANLGDILIFFGAPIVLIVLGIYKVCLNRYYKLSNISMEKKHIEEDGELSGVHIDIDKK